MNLLAETGRHEAFELSALAHAMTEDADDFDLDVEVIPREDWSNGSSGSSVAGQTTSISFGRELDEFPYSRFELTSETYDVVQAVHYCKQSLPFYHILSHPTRPCTVLEQPC